jgi:amino acid transporter
MLNRVISKWQLLATAVGGIVGSGWLFGPMLVAKDTGPASIFAWMLGGTLMIFIVLTFAELGTAYPVAGGTARYTHFSHGPWVSFTLAWVAYLASVIVPAIETMAAVQYAANYIPNLVSQGDGASVVLSPLGIGASCAVMALMCFINVYAVRVFAKSNSWLVLWKFAVPLIAALLLISHNWHSISNISDGNWFPYGIGGMLKSLPTAGIIFSFIGFSPAIQLAAEAKNPQIAVPFAILGAIILALALYVLVQFAFILALPAGSHIHGWHNLHFMNDSGPVAALLTAAGFIWFVKIIYLDAFVSPLGTAFIYTASTARLGYGLSKNDYFPEVLQDLNKAQVPYKAILLNYFVGILFFLPFPGWQGMVSFLVSCFILAYAVGPIACVVLRKKDPTTVRPFKLKGYILIANIAFIVCNLLIYWSGWTVVWRMMVAVLFGYVYLFIFFYIRKRSLSELSFAAGVWTIPYLLGLALLSFVGDFGGRHYLPFGWDCLVVALFSIVIFYYAVRCAKYHVV